MLTTTAASLAKTSGLGATGNDASAIAAMNTVAALTHTAAVKKFESKVLKATQSKIAQTRTTTNPGASRSRSASSNQPARRTPTLLRSASKDTLQMRNSINQMRTSIQASLSAGPAGPGVSSIASWQTRQAVTHESLVRLNAADSILKAGSNL